MDEHALGGTELRLQLQRAGLEIAAKRWGNPGGERILALHGWLDNAASFDQLALRFPECDWVAVDLPGHGRSQHRSPDAHYHFLDWLPVVGEIAEALGWAQFNLVGHSMGAGIGSLYAAAAPTALNA